MPDNNVRIKLSADTSQAQKDIKLIDQQIKELGKGAGSKGGSKSEETSEKTSAKDIGLGNLDALINVDKQILKVLNNMYRMSNNPNSNRSVKYIAGRIDALGENLKGTSAGKSSGNNSGGATTGTAAPQTNNTGGTSSKDSGKSSGGGSGGSSFGTSLKQAAGKLATATAALAVLKGIANWVGTGAEKSASLESKAYMTYNSTRIFGNNFSSARNYAYGVGNPYGYGSEATMDFQDSYMARAGFTNKENLTSDTSSLMRVSKAYGIDLSNTGSVAGKYVQSGTFASGEQSKFANLLATSINEAGMTGRESEQLDVLESINDTLAQTLVTVSEDGQNNATALYNLLAATEDSLKGARGASAIASINDAITGGGNTMDILLGWGTKYTGAAGRWELEKRKAEGISNPDNLSEIFSNYERITGFSINSDQGKLALKQELGIDPELVEILVQNAESIKSGNYSDSFISALESYNGDSDVSGLIDNYNKSKVSTQEQYANAKENAQSSAGDFWNGITKPFKDWFTGLTPGQQAGATMGGMAARGYATYKGGKWAANKFGDAWSKLFGKDPTKTYTADEVAKAFGTTTDDVANVFGKAKSYSADDIAKAFGTTTDDAAKFMSGLDKGVSGAASGVDDALKGAANGMDDAMKGASGLDDALKGAAGGLDDAVKGASKAGSALGKLGKALGWIGIAMEVVSTGIDTKDAIDRDDGRTAASEIGEGIGSIGGGAGGAWAGAAIGTAIFPGVGTAIGGVLGGLLGGFGGAALGEAAGEGIWDATTEKKELSEEQKKQIIAYYNEVSRLYNEKGNNAAQDYTLQTVVPYLNSIGISTSITDEYKNDVGKPDFMKDYENGVFPGLNAGTHVSSSGRVHGGSGGKFKLGLNYVPYDEFRATLHQGEAVLTADEAKKWRSGSGNQSSNTTVSTSESTSKVVDKFYEAVKLESESLEKREKYSVATSTDYTNITNALSSVSNNTKSNNVEEAKQTGKSSIWNRVLNFFGFNTSAAVGNDYIPYDNTPVNAHKGEAVLTADEAKKWRERNSIESINSSISVPQSSGSTYTGTNLLEIKLSGAVDGMTYENQHIIVQAVIQQLGLSKSSVLGNLGNSFVRTPN